MGYIKYSKDKTALSNFLTNNPRACMEVSAARVIQATTNTPIEIPEDAEVIDMCKAIDDMIKEGKAEGILETLAGLVKDGLLTCKEAASRANMTEAAFEAAMKKFS